MGNLKAVPPARELARATRQQITLQSSTGTSGHGHRGWEMKDAATFLMAKL